MAGRSVSEPGSPEMRAARETDCGSVGSAEPLRSRRRPRRHRETGHMRCPNSPGSERTACQDGMVAKARNHSRVASALPHSEGIAYKPPCGEVAMGRRVGRMGPAKRGRTGTAEPGPERGPLGRRVTPPPRRCIIMVGGPAQYGTTAPTLRCTKGDGKPAVSGACREQASASDDPGRPRLTGQPSSRTGENPPYGMSGGIEETSASFEARSAPRSYPTAAGGQLWIVRRGRNPG